MNGESEVAQLCMKFMNRVQLQGTEVMHFVACMQWLESKTQPAVPPQPQIQQPQDHPQDPPAKPAPSRARKG